MLPANMPVPRRSERPDGTLGPPVRRPWLKWDAENRGDMISGLLAAVATFFTAGSLFYAPPEAPRGFIWIAPLVAAGFFVALIAMWSERERHGVVRALLAGGAAVLAIAGFIYMGEVPAGRLVLFYWLPAILAISGALVLMRTKRAGHHAEVKVPHSRTRI